MKKVILLLVFTVISALTIDYSAQKAAPLRDAPATSTIQNIDPLGVPYRIQSDSQGAYKNGLNSVVSIVQGIGNWELDMLSSVNRRIYVDLSEPVPNTNPANLPAPFLSANVSARFISKCLTNITTMSLNGTTLCPLAIAMDYSGTRYAIRIQKDNYPGTEEVLWTCTSSSSGKCTGWKMQSDPNGKGKVAAQLLKITTVNGKTVEEKMGQYYFSFSVNVTTP
jgi:hypothetical protein